MRVRVGEREVRASLTSVSCRGLRGLDAIAVTQRRDDEILAFQARDRLKRPWIYLEGSK